MSDEITTEVLAKTTNATTETARSDSPTMTLNVGGKDVTYAVLDRVGNDRKEQLNAVAIAPKNPDGTTDYNNVAVVFAGTNNADGSGDTGRSGTLSAIHSMSGNQSEEYQPASRFLEKTLKSVEAKGGRVTDVSGFSQSGGYLMKIAAKYGPKHGFQSTSFDDFGGDQSKRLRQ